MNRSAPQGGYNFGNKRQYRRNIWATARSFTDPHERSQAQILLMPSIEGKEIEVAENNGFRQCNMHVVDKNPAIVAHLKRRYPHITTYGVDIVAAVKRIAKAGIRLKVANFDLCSTAEHVKPIVKEIAGLPAFSDYHLIFITCQRGRDHKIARLARYIAIHPEGGPNLKELIESGAKRGFSATDSLRFGTLFYALAGKKQWLISLCNPPGIRMYKTSSGHLTMMYFGVGRDKYSEESSRWWNSLWKRKALTHKEKEKKELVQSCINNVSLN